MWTIEYSDKAARDFQRIFDHLYDSYTDLGDDPDTAMEQAATRLRAIRDTIKRLERTPYIVLEPSGRISDRNCGL